MLNIKYNPTKTFPHFININNYKNTQLFNIQINPNIHVPQKLMLNIKLS